jgi:hypothetical protein
VGWESAFRGGRGRNFLKSRLVKSPCCLRPSRVNLKIEEPISMIFVMYVKEPELV